MLFKEKLFLSNIDSVKELSNDETKKRILIALVFGSGIILSPNILLDNKGILDILKQKNVIKFLNEEGHNQFQIRGFNIEDFNSFLGYFDSLPNSYKISSLSGKEKGKLTSIELKLIKQKLKELDDIIKTINPVYQNAEIATNSLSLKIKQKLSESYFDNNEEYKKFLFLSKELVSRSDWYKFIYNYFEDNHFKIESIKREIIDPSYNSLFIKDNECFIQDNIKYLDNIPEKILSSGVTYKSLRDEIELIEYALDIFEVVSTLGTTKAFNALTDRAIDYIEDKIVDSSSSYFSRRNWFGLYPILRKKMGIEIK